MPLKLVEMEVLLQDLEANFPELEWEVDRDWVWLTSDLGPLHRNKCVCEICAERTRIRTAIGKNGLGFSFAPRGHAMESGATGMWAHRCTHPTKFKRRSKGRSESAPESATTETLSDDQLLAMIGG